MYMFHALSVHLFNSHFTDKCPPILLLLIFDTDIDTWLVIFGLVDNSYRPLVIASGNTVEGNLVSIVFPLVRQPLRRFGILVNP